MSKRVEMVPKPKSKSSVKITIMTARFAFR